MPAGDVKIGVEINTKLWNSGLKKIVRNFSPVTVSGEMEIIADQILKFAIDSPVPRDVGDLANSAEVESDPQNYEVVFGFNRIYAAFQDQPKRKSGSITIRPRLKKVLFIPLTQKGRRVHQRDRNPIDEGLIPEQDYVLRTRAVIPIKSYGSNLGPNHYFSETLKRKREWLLERFALRLYRKLKQQVQDFIEGKD